MLILETLKKKFFNNEYIINIVVIDNMFAIYMDKKILTIQNVGNYVLLWACSYNFIFCVELKNMLALTIWLIL